MQNRSPAWPGGPAQETHMLWKNRDSSKTYTLPSGATVSIPRLREGVERFAITDINNPAGAATAQSDTIVSWDENRAYGAGGGGLDSPPRFNHLPGGVNILYMDGHVEFAKFRTEGGHAWCVNQHSFIKPDPSWPNLDFP
jgi:prepilin-type processing-associated H-X9-DG protein